MDYKIEDVSPVEKNVTVTVSPEEVEAAIAGSAAVLAKSVQLDGFRKGKAPIKLVEKHFQERIYDEARQDLINVHINDVLQQAASTPVAGIDIQGAEKPLEKGKEYVYSMHFEVLPKFELPQYEGLSVTEEKAVANEDIVNRLLEKIRADNARLTPVDGIAPATDGQIANIDFEAFDNGVALPELKTVNFNFELGAGQALPAFEQIVKGIPVGNTGEGEVAFPEDFIDEKLAGKTLTMKVTVNAVKQRDLPDLDDNFAKSLGQDSLEKLREHMRESYTKTMQGMNRSAAQKKLLDQMLKMTDFMLPPSLVKMESRLLLTDLAARMDRQGKSISSLGKNLEQLLEEVRPQAEDMARNQVLLLSIAKKESLEVTDQEATLKLYAECMNKGEDFQQTLEGMQRNGMIFEYRDRLLADKAMDLVYERANVTMVEPGISEKDETAPDATAPADAGSDEKDDKN